jgi:hypothetical protein
LVASSNSSGVFAIANEFTITKLNTAQILAHAFPNQLTLSLSFKLVTPYSPKSPIMPVVSSFKLNTGAEIPAIGLGKIIFSLELHNPLDY